MSLKDERRGDAAQRGTAAQPFRFFDNREKYLQFVSTCDEKWQVAQRVAAEIEEIAPSPPAMRIFDAGVGDGSVLSSLLRRMHEAYPTMPFLVVGKEISIEDANLTLEKLPDRFSEHPQLVVAITNMFYSEAPSLNPATAEKRAALNWVEVALEGETAHDFDRQIQDLAPLVKDHWQVTSSPKTGNPLYSTPSVLLLFRADHRFQLDSVIPRRGAFDVGYDLIVASQPYRLRAAAESKIRLVLEPLAKALAPGGRMITIHSTGLDPGMDIIRGLWPEEAPFGTPGPMLLKLLLERLRAKHPERCYREGPWDNSLFRYKMQVTSDQLNAPISLPTLIAAWNAATYVAQIDDRQVAAAMAEQRFLAATEEVLTRHGGLWFTDESFVVIREDEASDDFP